ncbi:MAG: hypothetical protein LBU34_15730 [Planctomycetaceae bacterium]|jgi:predicted transcriptional regulator|nr:hypothetical protein [Planctomycetaceae bacterium]
MSTQTQPTKPVTDLPDKENENDIQYRQYVQDVVAEGQRQVQDGRIFTLDQVEKKLEQWLK